MCFYIPTTELIILQSKFVITTFFKKLLLQHIASKHVMTSQCISETENPCVKLRFFNNIERKCRASKTDISKSFAKKELVNEKMHGNVLKSYIKDAFKKNYI